MKLQYKHTVYASYLGYITQAIVNNLPPLLFITFQKTMGISLSELGFLVSLNFGVQMLVDLISAKFVDRIGYRVCIVAAHICSTVGLVGLGLFPKFLPSPYLGLMIAVVINAIGGGLIEVLVSPIVQALPGDEKASAMSMLHSFYCWGHVLVVVASTVFFRVAGIGNWQILAFIWALVPFFNCFYFARVPIRSMTGEDRGMSMRQLAGSGVFWLFVLLMVCSGASEQAMSQWASAFAESALQVGKTMGDLLGPCLFALLMGTSRAVYARFSRHMPLIPFMVGSGFLCIAGYLLAVWSKAPVMALMGCGLCGLSVGILWPGTFSLSCARIPRGGTAMAALLALGGDVGCSLGPTVVGLVSNTAGGSIRAGLLAAVVFPVLLLLCLSRAGKRGRKAEVIGEVV